MAKNKESGGNPDRDNNQRKGQGNNQNRQSKDSSVDVYKDGMNTTPESWAQDQKRKEHESKKNAIEADTAAKKAEIENIKIAQELKKAKEEAGIKDEAVVVAAAETGVEPKTAKEAEKVIEVKADKDAQKAVDTAPVVVAELAKEGEITPEQQANLEKALESPKYKEETKGRIKNFFKRHSALFGGVLGGAVVKSAIRYGLITATGGTGWGVAIGGGALAGGLVEGGKALYRETMRYNLDENIKKLREEKDPYKKAAIYNTLQKAYDEARVSGSEEQIADAGKSLREAKTDLDATLAKEKFANSSEKEKLSYLLNLSADNQKAIPRTDRKEMEALIKRMNTELGSERTKKGLFTKERWKRVGWAALKGAGAGAIGGAVGYGVAQTAGELAPYVKDWLGYGSAEKASAVGRLATESKELALNHNYSEKIGSKGVTGAYREMLNDYISQQRLGNPNYTSNIKLEHLVYAEDYLKDAALERGVATTEGVINASGAELQQAIDNAMKLDPNGVENINELINGKKHFISQAVRSEMMNWSADQLNNPDNNALLGLSEKLKGMVIADGLSSNKELFQEGTNSHLLTLLVTNAVVEEAILARYRTGRSGVIAQESGTSTEVSAADNSNTVTESEPVVEPENKMENEANAELAEQRRKTLEKAQSKLESAGMKITVLNAVWENGEELSKSKKQIDKVTDEMIDAFNKHSGTDSIKPLAIEFNFKEDMLTEVQSRDVDFGSVNALFVRVPMHHKKSYYKDAFKDFFKENSVSPQPEVDAESEEEDSEPIPKPTTPISPQAKKTPEKKFVVVEPIKETKEQKMAWSEFNNKYTNKDEVIKVDLVKESLEFKILSAKKKLNKDLMYNKIDVLLQQMKEKGHIPKEQWAKLKGIEIVTRAQKWEKEAKPDVLYIEGEFIVDTDLDEPDDRGHWKAMWERQITRIP